MAHCRELFSGRFCMGLQPLVCCVSHSSGFPDSSKGSILVCCPQHSSLSTCRLTSTRTSSVPCPHKTPGSQPLLPHRPRTFIFHQHPLSPGWPQLQVAHFLGRRLRIHRLGTLYSSRLSLPLRLKVGWVAGKMIDASGKSDLPMCLAPLLRIVL